MRNTETDLRCQACGARHVVFESRPDYRGVMPASELTAFRCQQCKALLFEQDVKDGCSVLVLRAEDPLVPEIRAERRSLRRHLEPLRAWWADTDRFQLLSWGMGVLLLAAAVWLLSLE